MEGLRDIRSVATLTFTATRVVARTRSGGTISRDRVGWWSGFGVATFSGRVGEQPTGSEERRGLA